MEITNDNHVATVHCNHSSQVSFGWKEYNFGCWPLPNGIYAIIVMNAVVRLKKAYHFFFYRSLMRKMSLFYPNFGDSIGYFNEEKMKIICYHYQSWIEKKGTRNAIYLYINIAFTTSTPYYIWYIISYTWINKNLPLKI